MHPENTSNAEILRSGNSMLPQKKSATNKKSIGKKSKKGSIPKYEINDDTFGNHKNSIISDLPTDNNNLEEKEVESQEFYSQLGKSEDVEKTSHEVLL